VSQIGYSAGAQRTSAADVSVHSSTRVRLGQQQTMNACAATVDSASASAHSPQPVMAAEDAAMEAEQSTRAPRLLPDCDPRLSKLTHALGVAGMAKASKATALIHGLNAAGAEAARLLMMSGLERVVLVDDNRVAPEDLCAQAGPYTRSRLLITWPRRILLLSWSLVS